MKCPEEKLILVDITFLNILGINSNLGSALGAEGGSFCMSARMFMSL